MNLIDLSIRRPIFICMVTVFFVVLGLLAVRTLPVDLYPDVSPPVLTVRVQFPGASPEEVEELVVKPLEDVLSTVGGVKTLSSASREGTGFVSLEFEAGRDVRQEENQVRAKVAEARRSLPEDIREPTVSRQNIDETPIVELVVSGPRSVSELSDIAENIVAKQIRQLEGVGEVSLSGERTREVRVELLPERLAAFRLNATDVTSRLSGAVSQDPAGKLEGSERVWLLRMQPSAARSAELEDIVVSRTVEGQPVRLGEVARVTEGFNRPSRVNRFFGGGADAKAVPSVGIEVTRQSGQNTLTVASRVQEALVEIESRLPADVSLVVTSDASGIIRINVLDVVETLLIAAVLTVVVVLIFLQSPRSTITTAISLPSSVLTTFLAMKVAGFTINTMTLLGLTLAIGIIVDDAIVVRENIFRHMSELGKDAKRAASDGTKEVALAVIATTLTLVAVFVPVAGLQSVTGQFFKPFALTVAFAVLVSSWDALTMAPLLSAHFANVPSPAQEWARLGPLGRGFGALLANFEHAFHALEKVYGRFVRRILRLHLLQVALLTVSIGLVAGGLFLVRKGFLPTQLGLEFRVSLSGPLSVPPETVAKLLPAVEEKLKAADVLESFSLSGGTGFAGNAFVNVSARAKPSLSKSQQALSDVRQKARAALSGFPGYSVRIQETSDPLAGGGGRFAPVVVNISGDNLENLSTLARDVQRVMEGTPGLADVSSLAEEGLSEFRVRVDEARAGLLGITPRLVTENLRVWVQGETALYLKEGETQVPVVVSLEGGSKLGPADLLRYSLYGQGAQGSATRATASGVDGIPLASVASIESASGPTLISRENRRRTLRVFSGLAPGAALGEVVPELQTRLQDVALPEGATWKVTGQGEQMNAFFGELVLALLLGAVFVYMVLASLFEDLAHPFTVMMAIPLAGSGALLTLWAFNVPLDLYGGIGLVLLSGIVAKNGILIVDMALETRRQMPTLTPEEAMERTAPKRLRPILMTSLAMIVGMLPIATGLGVGGATRQSLGLATVGGVVSSTVLSLVLIPSIYVWVEHGLDVFRRRRQKNQVPAQTALS
ncbi:MAG: efflux RND transporter permease subunit [Silvanigrellales bacterium]|nr:efflux RND transporter permease subunit [Silvanigrellales bacterium]